MQMKNVHLRRTLGRMTKGFEQKGFSSWVYYVKSKRAAEAKVRGMVELMKKTIQRILQSAIFRGFNRWRKVVQDIWRMEQLMEKKNNKIKMLTKICHKQLSMGLHAWSEYVH